MVLAEAPLTGVATQSDTEWMSRYTPQERVHIDRLQQFLGTDPFAYLRDKIALYPEPDKKKLYQDQYKIAMDLLDKIRRGAIGSPVEFNQQWDEHERDEAYLFLEEKYKGLSVTASRVLLAFIDPLQFLPGIEYRSEVLAPISKRS